MSDRKRFFYFDRLAEISKLGPDWDSYGAAAPTDEALTQADRLTISPTPEGGVSFEWPDGPIVEVLPDGTFEATP
jgi:hypothetical protein